MKTTKALFFELMFDFRSERWNEFELPKLSLRELLGLAKLLGCPSCGSKETVIVRLLAQRELRLKLARFTDNPEELANSDKRELLRDMCREAGIWRSGNKRALSAGLLNWRDRSRARGQAFLAQMQSLARDRPQQLSFRFKKGSQKGVSQWVSQQLLTAWTHCLLGESVSPLEFSFEPAHLPGEFAAVPLFLSVPRRWPLFWSSAITIDIHPLDPDVDRSIAKSEECSPGVVLDFNRGIRRWGSRF